MLLDTVAARGRRSADSSLTSGNPYDVPVLVRLHRACARLPRSQIGSVQSSSGVPMSRIIQESFPSRSRNTCRDFAVAGTPVRAMATYRPAQPARAVLARPRHPEVPYTPRTVVTPALHARAISRRDRPSVRRSAIFGRSKISLPTNGLARPGSSLYRPT